MILVELSVVVASDRVRNYWTFLGNSCVEKLLNGIDVSSLCD
jgi:hypothetical protein